MSRKVFWSGLGLSLLWIAVMICVIGLIVSSGINIQFIALGVLIFLTVGLIYYLNRKGILLIPYSVGVSSVSFKSMAWILSSVYALLGVLSLLIYLSVSSLLDKPAYRPELLSISILTIAFLGASLLMIGTAFIVTSRFD